MRIISTLSVGALLLSASTIISPPSVGAAPIEETFSFTGDTVEWVVPDGVEEILVESYGAEGGSSSTSSDGAPPASGAGGLGGTTTATIAVTAGETLILDVGGRGGDAATTYSDEGMITATSGAPGFNGGGCGGAYVAASDSGDSPDGWLAESSECGGTAALDFTDFGYFLASTAASGGGGGATTVRRGSTVLVAAAGGGGGGAWMRNTDADGDWVETFDVTAGGAGGGASGEPGGVGELGSAAAPGTQDDGGADGAGFGSVGAGNTGPNNVAGYMGGGGGGGWFGGESALYSGGGGGSSHPVTATDTGVREGNGALRITAEASPPAPVPAQAPAQDTGVAPAVTEAPRPQTPKAEATVQQPSFTG